MRGLPSPDTGQGRRKALTVFYSVYFCRWTRGEPFLKGTHPVHGLKNITVLHAHAQMTGMSLAGQFTAQTTQIHAFGHHDFKHKKRMIRSAFAQNGLETLDVYPVAGKWPRIRRKGWSGSLP